MRLTRIFFFCIGLFFFSLASKVIAQSNNGSLKIETNLPDSFYVAIDDNIKNARKINTSDIIEVPSGSIKLSLISNYNSDFHTTLHIQPDSLSIFKKHFSSFRINYQTSFSILEAGINTTIFSDSLSSIYIDGDGVGTHKVELLLNPKEYKLIIKNSKYGSLRDHFEVEYGQITNLYRFNNNPKPASLFLKLLPGGAYLSTGHEQKAFNTYKGFGFLAAAFTVLQVYQIDKTNTYNRNIKESGFKIKGLKSEINQIKQGKVFVGLGAGLLYLITTIDGFRKPDNGYIIKPASITFKNENLSSTHHPSVSLLVNL